MVAEFGQQLWLCTNFRCSDRTLRSRDRILDFSQEMVKTSAGAENLTSAEVLTCPAGTTGRYTTGKTPPIKAERPVPSDHLRSTCTRGNTIYKDLNESSSARLGGSQQLEILPSPIVRGGRTFPYNFDRRRSFDRRGNFAGAEILPGAEISTSPLVLSHIVRRMDFAFSNKFPSKFFPKFST